MSAFSRRRSCGCETELTKHQGECAAAKNAARSNDKPIDLVRNLATEIRLRCILYLFTVCRFIYIEVCHVERVGVTSLVTGIIFISLTIRCTMSDIENYLVHFSEFKERFQPIPEEHKHFLDDVTFKRYLVARQGNLDKAEAMLRETLAWRSEFKVDHEVSALFRLGSHIFHF